tara:strand:- start:441 stop:3740 length:3300 start_codon:yes stop_codon:yes gene_type:complete
MIVEKPIQDLLNQASLVVEGKVLSQQGYRDIEGKNIYTINQIKIFKIFKGFSLTQQISVVTQGGVIDLEMEKVSNALELEVGDMGLFILDTNLIDLGVTDNLYHPVDGVLGYLKYDLLANSAIGVYENFPQIQGSLYNTITNIIQLPITTLSSWDYEDSNITPSSSTETAIVSENLSGNNDTFESHAGVSELMIIIGSDFGDEQGSVLFPDANNGGNGFIAALDYQIKLWTSNRVEVEVPYRAGTGKVRIDKADGESLISSEDVLLGYDHINVKYEDNGEIISYETQLIADNSIDGYDFQFFTDFSNNVEAAKGFENLLDTWGCSTAVNFKRGIDSTIDEDAKDGVNIVRFDNGTELSGSVLGYARSRYSGCRQGDSIKWYVYEIEVVMNDDYNWYYGDGIPASNEFDFETVMLHEIGHTQQLGHVINTTEVMHFSVGAGQRKRELSNIDKLGGQYVTDKSTSEQVCNLPLMQYYTACCLEMEVIAQPENQILCESNIQASLYYNVNNASIFQWQRQETNIWVNLTDNENYSGADTDNLIIASNLTTPFNYRAIASNSCNLPIISDEVAVEQIVKDFSLVDIQPTCVTLGYILVNRNTNKEDVVVRIFGENTISAAFPNDKSVLEIPLISGDYQVVIEHTISECIEDLGPVVLKTATPLILSTSVLNHPDCSGNDGAISVAINNHPDFNELELSLDNGNTFTSYPDDIGNITISNLEKGTYNVIGKWENGSCRTISNSVELTSQVFSNITFKTTPMTCNSEGSITLSRSNISQTLEVAINGTAVNNDWVQGQSNFTIEIVAGDYAVVLTNPETNCKFELDAINVLEMIPLVLSASVTDQLDCSDSKGTINIEFNNHPLFETVQLSLDGGTNYISYNDNIGSIELKGLESGEYEIVGKWENEPCSTELISLFVVPFNSAVGACKSIILNLASDGQISLDAYSVYDETTEIGCPNVSLSLSKSNFTCDNIGENTVQLTITDESGISTSCSTSVTITDNENYCDKINQNSENGHNTGENSVENFKVVIFPNPTSDIIYFHMEQEPSVFLQVFNTSGVMVIEEYLNANSDLGYFQNIETLSSGYYSLLLYTSKGTITKSIVIK